MLRISLIDRRLPKPPMEDAATVNAKTVSKSGEVDWLNLPTKLKILQVYQKRSYSSMYLRIEATPAGHRGVIPENHSRKAEL